MNILYYWINIYSTLMNHKLKKSNQSAKPISNYLTCKTFFLKWVSWLKAKEKKKLICENTLSELLTYFNIKMSRFACFYLYVHLHASIWKISRNENNFPLAELVLVFLSIDSSRKIGFSIQKLINLGNFYIKRKII